MTDERERAILQAALHVFAAEGFDRATMEDIAQKAKVAKGTLFYRYNSKEELFISLIRGAVQRFVDTVEQETEKLQGAIERIEKSIEIQTELSFTHPEFAKLLLSEVWGRQDRQRLFRASLQTYLQVLEAMIRQGIEEGEIRPVDPGLLATSLFGMTAAASLHLLLSEQDITPVETVAQIQGYWLQGIRV